MGKGVPHPATALVVEAQDLVVGVAHGAHLHGAALAHAHAVAKATRHQLEGIVVGLHRPQFIPAAVDAHAQRLFQLGKDIQGQRGASGAAAAADGHVKVQLGVQAAGRRIHGRVGRDGVDPRHAGIAAIGRARLAVQQAPDGGVLAGAGVILIHRHAALHRSGIHQVKGVVLDAQILIPAGVEAVGGRFRLPTVGSGVVGAGQRLAVHHHNAAGGVHRCGTVGRGIGIAVVHLVVGGVHHVVEAVLAQVHFVHRVGTRRHRLGLQRLNVGGVAHLIRHHAVEIILDVHMHNGIQPPAAAGLLRGEVQVSGVEVVRHSGLGNAQAVAALGCMAAQRHGLAHGIALSTPHHGDLPRGLVKINVQRFAAGQGHILVAVSGIAARYGDVHLRGISHGREMHPHHAILRAGLYQRRSLYFCCLCKGGSPAGHQQYKTQDQTNSAVQARSLLSMLFDVFYVRNDCTTHLASPP